MVTPAAYAVPLGFGDDQGDLSQPPERFEFAKRLIIEAGDLALQYFASVNELAIMSKGAQDMVSEADIAWSGAPSQVVAVAVTGHKIGVALT
jgi:fructose-1,6-bisphosphatase/inositol monophosphatase family enzyme